MVFELIQHYDPLIKLFNRYIWFNWSRLNWSERVEFGVARKHLSTWSIDLLSRAHTKFILRARSKNMHFIENRKLNWTWRVREKGEEEEEEEKRGEKTALKTFQTWRSFHCCCCCLMNIMITPRSFSTRSLIFFLPLLYSLLFGFFPPSFLSLSLAICFEHTHTSSSLLLFFFNARAYKPFLFSFHIIFIHIFFLFSDTVSLVSAIHSEYMECNV